MQRTFNPCLKSIIKCQQNPTLTFEFQTSTLKLLVYNYVIVLLIANQEVGWSYSFKDIYNIPYLSVKKSAVGQSSGIGE
ncbi:hypothetical protein DOY81_014830 [Sarcophaga bullata]|nr:hypothetical protein DOY81_014830 [Sarcophaga bullata]